MSDDSTSCSPFSLSLQDREAAAVPIKLLAHLGDAVFELFERERQIMSASSAKKLHHKVVLRVNARSQAAILATLLQQLNPSELDVVRRARNLKITGNRKVDQSAYRHATAFEALIGFLYLTDKDRLRHILELTLAQAKQTQ